MKKITVLAFISMALCFLSKTATAQKISGLVYMDYFHNVLRDSTGAPSSSAQTGIKDLYGFQLRRSLFTVDYDISPKITSRFRIDVDGTAMTSKDSSGKSALYPNLGIFLKDLYVQVNDVVENHDIIMGIQPTLAFMLPESVWGYRSVEKMITDMRGIPPVRDFALTFKGRPDSAGKISYAVQYGNAATLNESDKYKRLSASVAVKPIKNLNISVYGERKWQSGNKNVVNLSFFAGYVEKEKYAVGAEYVVSSADNSYMKPDSTFTSLNKSGISVYGSYYLTPELVALARVDMFAPNTDVDATDYAKTSNAKSNLSENYIIVGLDWKVNKKFSVIPNIQFSTFSEMKNSATNTATKFSPSMTARITCELKL